MDLGAGIWVVLAVIVFFGAILISGFFTVHTKQAAIVERFGKFNRIAGPGLNFKTPLIEKVVYVEDLNMQLMDVPVMSKTKDDATVTVPVRVQYFVLADKVKEAYYELDDPEDQIKAHVENVILSYIPKINLDDFDALRDIGAQSNTILLPHSPSAVAELNAQLRNAITSGTLAAMKSAGKPSEAK
jgi:regulator of protease activity HflC (stomatin/prohibitin superfamily)